MEEENDSSLDSEFELLAPLLNENFNEYHQKSFLAAKNLFVSLGAEEFLNIVESRTFSQIIRCKKSDFATETPWRHNNIGRDILHDALIAKTIDHLEDKRGSDRTIDHFLSPCPALKVMLTNRFNHHLKKLREQGFADSAFESNKGNFDSWYIIMAFHRAALEDYQNELYAKMIHNTIPPNNIKRRNYCNIPFKLLMLGLILTFIIYLWYKNYQQEISQDMDTIQNKIAK